MWWDGEAWSQILVSSAQWQDKRQLAQTEIQEILIKEKDIFYCKFGSALQHTSQRTCRVLIFRDIKNLSGHGPEQPTLNAG